MRSLALILTFSCFGCGTTLDYTAKAEPPRPVQARPANQVEVFMTSAPKQPFVEVGVIEAQQQPGTKDQAPEVIAKMQALAGEHGCDGLANFTSNDHVTEEMLAPGGGSRKSTLSGYRASCIVFMVPPAPKVQAAPAAAVAQVANPVCVPNVTQLCYGPGGCQGGQSCTPDGGGWTSCDCGTAQPPAAATQ